MNNLLIFHILSVLVAILHLWFMILEMFLWTKPLGLAAFRQTLAQAEVTKVLAMNQGLYNGFLSAGILWGLFFQNAEVVCFFIVCVLVAGIFGALTANKKILYVQGFPALLTLLFYFLAHRS